MARDVIQARHTVMDLIIVIARPRIEPQIVMLRVNTSYEDLAHDVRRFSLHLHNYYPEAAKENRDKGAHISLCFKQYLFHFHVYLISFLHDNMV